MLSKLLRSTAARASATRHSRLLHTRLVACAAMAAAKSAPASCRALTASAVMAARAARATQQRRAMSTAQAQAQGRGSNGKGNGNGNGNDNTNTKFNRKLSTWMALFGGLSGVVATSAAVAFAEGRGGPPNDAVLRGERKAAYEALIAAMPVEQAKLTFAPEVPPPVGRDYPALVKVDLTSEVTTMNLTNKNAYDFWTFNGHCPGPFIRCRQGDMLEVSLTNNDSQGMPHNIDLHGTTGPGGGAALTLAEPGVTKTARFKMFAPGLFVYHCAAAPVPMHVANGMYGLLLVEPETPLPPVDKEYYVMQSEFYATEESDDKVADSDSDSGAAKKLAFSYPRGLREHADVVVFNGKEGALVEKPLTAKASDVVRLYVGNGGPNLWSAFHVIGCIFDKVYRDGDLYSPPARHIQTIGIPPGAAAVVELIPHTPGTYTLVDHALFRLDKGAVGFLNVSGEPRPDIYHSSEGPVQCVGCKLHS